MHTQNDPDRIGCDFCGKLIAYGGGETQVIVGQACPDERTYAGRLDAVRKRLYVCTPRESDNYGLFGFLKRRLSAVIGCGYVETLESYADNDRVTPYTLIGSPTFVIDHSTESRKLIHSDYESGRITRIERDTYLTFTEHEYHVAVKRLVYGESSVSIGITERGSSCGY